MLTLLVALLGIFLTIFFIIGFHEFGHFLAARLLGVKVLRFSIGFGKALRTWHGKTGTEYVLAAIPLGGYVKMLDEEEGHVATEELQFAYNRQPLYKKFLIVIAGPFSNFLLAFFLYWLLFLIGFTSIAPVIGKVVPHSIAANAGIKSQQEIISIDNKPTSSWMSIAIQILSHTGDTDQLQMETQNLNNSITNKYILNLTNWHMDKLKPDPLASLGLAPYEPNIPAVIGTIAANSPAAKSTLKIGDQFIAVNKKTVRDWYELIDYVAAHPEEKLAFTIKRNGKTQTVFITTEYQRDLFFKKYGFLGIAPQFHWPANFLRNNQFGPIIALNHAWQNTYDITYLNFLVIGKLFTGKVSLQSLGGPISIFESAGSALNQGIIPFMSFLAFLSIAIGVINIFPVPGLDGGHVLFQAIEAIIRRPVPARVQALFYRLGVILLLLLIVQAVVNDVLRL